LAELTKKLGAVQQSHETSTGFRSVRTHEIVRQFENQKPQQTINRSDSFVDNRVKQLESALQTEKKLLAEKENEIRDLQRQVFA
jgi:hypothetical protein